MNIGNKDDGLREKIRQVLDELEPKSETSTGCLDFISLNHVFGSKGGKGKRSSLQLFWALLIIACLGLCFYQTYERIAYYFTYPVNVVVNVVGYSNVTFPTFTFCLHDVTGLFNGKNAYSKIVNKSACEVDNLDVLGQPRAKTFEALWTLAKPKFNIKYTGRANPLRVPIISSDDIKLTDIPLPHTSCKKVLPRLPSYQYFGTLSILPLNFVMEKPNICKNPEFFLYQTEMYINPTSGRALPIEQMVLMMIKRRRFKSINTPVKSCVDINETSACEQDCYFKSITDQTSCWLPFMTFINKTTRNECLTVDEAKNARDTTTGIYHNLKPREVCKCKPPCDFSTFSVRLEAPQKNYASILELGIYFADNYVEEIVEVEAYSFITLLCDIGGNLGLYLGLSVLALIDALQSGVDSAEEGIGVRKKTAPAAAPRRHPARVHAFK